MGLSFLVPFLIGVLVLARIDVWTGGLRRALKRRRDARRRPGSSPLRPLRVPSFDAIAPAVEDRCRCGGSRRIAFQGATSSGKRRLWLVIQICSGCQARRQIYFDVTQVCDLAPLGSSPVTPSPR